MSRGGLAEKLDHSTILDIAEIGVYAWFAYVFYTNFGYDQSLLEITLEPNVLAMQMALAIIFVKVIELLHDRYISSSRGIHR